MTAIKALDHLVRFAGAAALMLGLALWAGQLYALLDIHMGLGIAVVLALWALAILALRRGKAHGLAVGSIVWGVVTLALGQTQTRLLVGDLHWLVQVAHLLVGVGAIVLVVFIARVLQTSRPA